MTGAEPTLDGEVVSRIEQHPLLKGIRRTSLHAILKTCKVHRLRRGAVLMHKYEDANNLFLMIEGQCEIEVGQSGGKRKILATAQPNSTVGEMGVLIRDVRSATATVSSDECLVVDVPRQALIVLLQESSHASLHLIEEFSNRIRNADLLFHHLIHSQNDPHPAPRSVWQTLKRWYVWLLGERLLQPGFWALAGFMVTACLMRAVVEFHPALKESFIFLKSFYISGLFVFILASFVLFFSYAHRFKLVTALVMGVGLGLLVNQVSLLIAFDIFYQDMLTRNANEFSTAILYDRSESVDAALVFGTLLILGVYFRKILRVIWICLKTLSRGAG